jgi:putative protease
MNSTHTNPKIELLAPGGDVDAIKAAIIAGANAVYCGLDNFNARNRASNISF